MTYFTKSQRLLNIQAQAAKHRAYFSPAELSALVPTLTYFGCDLGEMSRSEVERHLSIDYTPPAHVRQDIHRVSRLAVIAFGALNALRRAEMENHVERPELLRLLDLIFDGNPDADLLIEQEGLLGAVANLRRSLSRRA